MYSTYYKTSRNAISLGAIAHALGGKVRGSHVAAPGPEAAIQKLAWKRKRCTVTVYLNGDGDIGVNCHHPDQDPIATKDWVRERCGLPAWEPTKRKPINLPPLPKREQFLKERIRLADHRGKITFEQFATIINDLKNTCSDAGTLRAIAGRFARSFGFDDAAT